MSQYDCFSSVPYELDMLQTESNSVMRVPFAIMSCAMWRLSRSPSPSYPFAIMSCAMWRLSRSPSPSYPFHVQPWNNTETGLAFHSLRSLHRVTLSYWKQLLLVFLLQNGLRGHHFLSVIRWFWAQLWERTRGNEARRDRKLLTTPEKSTASISLEQSVWQARYKTETPHFAVTVGMNMAMNPGAIVLEGDAWLTPGRRTQSLGWSSKHQLILLRFDWLRSVRLRIKYRNIKKLLVCKHMRSRDSDWIRAGRPRGRS
jgi:hypothetical protein